MMQNFQIDSLDKQILGFLSHDARTSFLEIARQCHVSGALIHQRVEKLQDAGVVSGSQFCIEPKGLGFHTTAFVGIQVNLINTRTHEEVFEKISLIPEVVECHHTTGKYSLFLKIYSHNNEHLKKILVENIQSILEVTATETFISLEEGFRRQLPAD
ncbi:Transcriptional regulator AsnC [hydrothermal vent metagenome]|uniref:Transcriptional regulator AsnC n=1 Tax=hydrothermal vent metagenome TaxID=652676 RepID=A0A3B0VEY1_9ZZZZ